MTEEAPDRPAHHLRKTLRDLWADRTKRTLAISLGINYLLLEFVVIALATPTNSLFTGISPSFLLPSVILSVLLAGLFGFAATLALNPDRFGKPLWGWVFMILGAVLGFISTGCPGCKSPFLGLPGTPWGFSDYPLGGLELKLIAVILIVYALWVTLSESTLPSSEELEDTSMPLAFHPSRWAGARTWIPRTFLMVSTILALFLLPLVPASAKIQFNTELVNGSEESDSNNPVETVSDLYDEVLPPEGYPLPAAFGNIGPEMVRSGAIDQDKFVRLYEQAGTPLTQTQIDILMKGSNAPVVINQDNARFLLNFFWAFGLTNRNPILDEGPMQTVSNGEIGRFASTGGWTLGSKAATEIYSSAAILELSEAQQARVEAVAAKIYRPCCNNSTLFPDCNHGMAMLGLMELLAAQDATEAEMLEAAKFVNAFWFPQQAIEIAVFFQAAQGMAFDVVDAELAVGPEIFSSTGFAGVHNLLAENGLLGQSSDQGSGCGV